MKEKFYEQLTPQEHIVAKTLFDNRNTKLQRRDNNPVSEEIGVKKGSRQNILENSTTTMPDLTDEKSSSDTLVSVIEERFKGSRNRIHPRNLNKYDDRTEFVLEGKKMNKPH